MLHKSAHRGGQGPCAVERAACLRAPASELLRRCDGRLQGAPRTVSSFARSTPEGATTAELQASVALHDSAVVVTCSSRSSSAARYGMTRKCWKRRRVARLHRLAMVASAYSRKLFNIDWVWRCPGSGSVSELLTAASISSNIPGHGHMLNPELPCRAMVSCTASEIA
jgi:hypothetical protein